MTEPLAPPLALGATVGILGGGQLGRMLSVAAARLGLRCHVYEPGAGPPAGDVAHRVTTAPYDDAAALTAFADFGRRHHLRVREHPDLGARPARSPPPDPPRPPRAGGQPGPDRREGFPHRARPHHGALPGGQRCRRARRRAGRDRHAGDPQDHAAGLRRQGPDADRDARRGRRRACRDGGVARGSGGLHRLLRTRSASSPPAARTARSPPTTRARTSTRRASCTPPRCRPG